MTAPSRSFNKEYLPGYTGHVPSKNNLFGLTAGSINQAVIETNGKGWELAGLTTAGALTSKIYSEKAPRNKVNKEVFGNWSKYAKGWISGPTHETAVQRVPGYTGHVKGLIAENLFAKSYARTSAQAFSKRHAIGADLAPKNRFRSSQREDFKPSNFRRFVERKDMIPQRDYSDFTKYVNDQQTGVKESLLARTMRTEGRYRNRGGTAAVSTR